MSEAAWSGLAVNSHPEVVRAVHEDYIAAGAEVIITNTFGTARFLLEPAGLGNEFENINRKAVQLAAQARDGSGKDIAIAGSISNLPPGMKAANYPDPDLELAALKELAAILADSGVDLIALEMMQDTRHAARAMEAALETGLPVWLGVSCTQRAERRWPREFRPARRGLRQTARCPHPDGSKRGQYHAQRCRRRAAGDLDGAPNAGRGPSASTRKSASSRPRTGRSMPMRRPTAWSQHARGWADSGVLLVGGCCGTTPAHIAALARAFG